MDDSFDRMRKQREQEHHGETGGPRWVAAAEGLGKRAVDAGGRTAIEQFDERG